MENTKKGNGLVVFLIILVVLLATGLGLLLGGVIKNPFVKEEKCTKCNVETKTEKKTDKTEKKETRYYQFISNLSQEMDSSGNPIYFTFELLLDKDGTAKIAGKGVNDYSPMSGKYVEDEKYIIATLNDSRCVENGENQIAGNCAETMVLIKDGETLKYQPGTLFHFEIDDVNEARIYKQVQKKDLLTDLKN